MPDQQQIYNQHSEEATEILGRIPSWTIRWGITVIFAIFAAIAIGCCFIQYPDKVIANVVITMDENGEGAFGTAILPSANFGKVQPGQQVNVKLNAYPYMEYGMVRGVTGEVSLIPQDDPLAQPQHTVELFFPNGMTTSYGNELNIIQKMGGTAEIITEEKTLIMRLLSPIRALFVK